MTVTDTTPPIARRRRTQSALIYTAVFVAALAAIAGLDAAVRAVA